MYIVFLGLTPNERRGDVKLSEKVKRILKDKKEQGESAFWEWKERKMEDMKEKRRLDFNKDKKWKEMEKKHYEKKKLLTVQKKKNILIYRSAQARRKMKGPPGHKTRKNVLASGKKKLRPMTAANSGTLFDLLKKKEQR